MLLAPTFKDVMVITLYNRLKACLEHRLRKPVAIEPAFAPTRVEQGLAWLPRNRVFEALDLPLPGCPSLGLVDASLQQRYAAFLVGVAATPAPLTDDAERESGRRLARELLSQAIDLGSSRAHEQSDEIYWLAQCAAIASLFADGAQSAEFAGYRQHVEYYRSSGRMAAQVKAFDRFVAASGQPVADAEALSCSADGRYRVMVSPWEPRHSLWVYSPRIIDTHQGTSLLRFNDACWSADVSTWHDRATVELALRKFPGRPAGKQVKVIIDCANRFARLQAGGEIELKDLERVLDAGLERD
ncbi:hypothetical protein [Pseudomonas sp. KU43P]|uniref:hypothetical protein n=1 Tax=Pseudomonas sp. KU43P TaxID=2487887 RepID=UPI0012A7F7D4|nr:hypothetical protein [Pseudomonas sp. KU43P]BBH46294.1 hypothetical protein KU43P_27710 [Pseudomonas sp. KU43P]